MPEQFLFTKEKGSLFNVKAWMKLLVKRVHYAMETKIEIGIYRKCDKKAKTVYWKKRLRKE